LALAAPEAAAIPRGRFAVGDSIVLSASDELADYGFATNAEVGRQFSAGVRVVKRLATHGKLPRHVVVHLGTNGPVDPDDCEALIRYAPRRQIYLVNVRVPRDWEDDVNATLRACAHDHARVHHLNWWKKSGRHLDEWIATDGYHLTADGQAAFAAWIDDRVDAVVKALRNAR
jgi:lysophospholipase L1-like esterase